MSRTATTRIDDELAKQLDSIAASMKRPRAFIVEQAIRRYVEDEAWQIEKIQRAADDYEQGRGETMPFEDYMHDLRARVEAKLEQ